MNTGPAHDAHRLAVIEACQRAGVTIYRSRLGFRLLGPRTDIEVSDLIHVMPSEIRGETPRQRIDTRPPRPRRYFRY